MEAILQIVGWATGSREGIVLVEYVILFILYWQYRKINKINEKVEFHEKECVRRDKANMKLFSEGSKKFALFEKRTEYIEKDLEEIKNEFKELNATTLTQDIRDIKAALTEKEK